MDKEVTISIVIPVKNGMATLGDCLAGIRSQTLYEQCEIIMIDSGSTDGTAEFLASQSDVRLYKIPAESFNHGLTRNYGVSLAVGEYVLMTVQDATAVDSQWLEKMIRHFDAPKVVAVCGQQVVPHHANKNPHEWFRPVSAPGVRKVSFLAAQDFDKLTPQEKKTACSWDDVNAMYRREALMSIPFREAFFAEDAMWAQDALRAGWELVYDTNSRVYHYHFQNFEYAYKRMLTALYFSYKIFGYTGVNTGNNFDYMKVIYRNFKYKAPFKWIPHNFQIMRAKDKAFRDFNTCLTSGETDLDLFYTNKCTVPPLGRSSYK